MAIENIREKRVGQIAVVCTDRERKAEFYGSVFGWEHALGTQSFMGETTSEVQNMQNAATSTRWLIHSRPGFQLEIFQYACPESRPLPENSRVSDHGYNRIVIATRSIAEVMDRVMGLDPELAAAFTVDEANDKRALALDPDGVLLEIFERPNDYRLRDIGIMNFAVMHPSMADFKEAYLHTCGIGMRSTSVPHFIPGKAAVVYQNTREGLSVEMLYAHTSIWGLIGFTRATWLDHILTSLAITNGTRCSVKFGPYWSRGR